MKIIRNSCKCLLCGEEVESTFRHDYKSCKCGNITVDGGKDYLKRSVIEAKRFKDTSIIDDE